MSYHDEQESIESLKAWWARWGNLTDDDFDVAKGDATYLAGKLQERYGWDQDRAQREVSEFEKSLH